MVPTQTPALTPPPVAALSTQMQPIQAPPPATTPPAQPSPQAPPPVAAMPIPASLFEEMFTKSASLSNYAKNLTFATFTKDELMLSSCTGAFGKQPLEKDPRMIQIIDMTFKKYHVEDKENTWRACRKAIDGSIRKLCMQLKCQKSHFMTLRFFHTFFT